MLTIECYQLNVQYNVNAHKHHIKWIYSDLIFSILLMPTHTTPTVFTETSDTLWTHQWRSIIPFYRVSARNFHNWTFDRWRLNRSGLVKIDWSWSLFLKKMKYLKRQWFGINSLEWQGMRPQQCRDKTNTKIY